MNCYAWDIPVGCYEAALDANGGACPFPTWFWLSLAAAAALVLTSGRKRKLARAARVARVRRKR